MIKLRSERNLAELLRKAASEFPLYTPEQYLYVDRTDGITHLSYRIGKVDIPNSSTRIEMQIEGDTAFLVFIELEEKERGKGLGKKLYEIAENIAKTSGCNKLQMTASGTTRKGLTRMEYVKSLGYTQINDMEAVKEF